MPDPIQNPENAQPSAPSVRNRIAKPPGILPKNTQTWVIAGLSAVMVAAIALSGNGSKSKSATTLPPQSGVIDPNGARIADYRNRLEEETRKLAAEQAALNKQAAAGVDPRLAAAMQPGVPANAYAAAPQPDDRQSARKQLESERERKEYSSLFASNVAFSLRKDLQEKDAQKDVGVVTPGGPASAPGMPTLLNAPTAPYPYLSVAPPGLSSVPPAAPATSLGPTQGAAPGAGSSSNPVPARAPQAEARSDEAEGQRTHPKPDPELTRADGQNYRLLEGTLLETVLTNRLTSSLAGPVNTMLATDVYAHDRQRLLIPRGSRVLGEVRPVTNFGQQRLAVVFHRIIMPDGYSVSLDQFQGLSQIGETGLRDQVNHHYLEIFGVSIAIGAVAGLSEAGTQYGFTQSATDEYRHGFATSLSQSALNILDRFLNILPTFTIREGHRIKIYLASDITVPAYDRHKVPNDF
jgi:type IV secretion system protein VirB10